MLALLDLEAEASYRVPITLINDHKSEYLIGAYIASLRYASRFNEAMGTFSDYLQFFGVKIDPRTGSTLDRMKTAMARLVELHFLQGSKTRLLKSTQNQGFILPFKEGQGWYNKDYNISVLFTIREIKQACLMAKRREWNGANNLIQVLNTLAYLRSHMEVASDVVMPRERYIQSCAIVDYDTCLRTCRLNEKSMKIHLDRIKTASLGVYQHVVLHQPGTRNKKELILLANKHDKAMNQLTRVRVALKKYYQGYQLSILDGART